LGYWCGMFVPARGPLVDSRSRTPWPSADAGCGRDRRALTPRLGASMVGWEYSAFVPYPAVPAAFRRLGAADGL